MQIYLFRHGIAEDRAPSGRDADRALTGEGRKKLREVLDVARKAGVKPELIITSPYTRAVQTAEIAADVLGYQGELLRTQALTPDAAPEDVLQELRLHRDCEQVLLASHEPLMSRCGSYLLNAPPLAVDFKKGGMLRIDVERFSSAPHGVLKWYLTPKLCP